MTSIPKYRMIEIKKIYDIFCDEETSKDIITRKLNFKNIIKLRYNWVDNIEYNNIYKLIKEDELKIIFDFKKKIISDKYKNKLIKLFCIIDEDNNNVIDINEFKILMNKFDIYNIDIINEMFINADTNNDNILSIDEFIEFLTNNKKLLEKLDIIIKSKIDYNNKNDKRNLLFKDFPGSPNDNNTNDCNNKDDKSSKKWRPSLANLRSPKSIKGSLKII